MPNLGSATKPVGVGLLTKASGQANRLCLTHCLRDQVSSHMYSADELSWVFFARSRRASIVDLTRINCGGAMEDIFVVKRCNKIVIHGRRAADSQQEPAEASAWFRICDTRTGGFFGDGFDEQADAHRECQRLNAASSQLPARQHSG